MKRVYGDKFDFKNKEIVDVFDDHINRSIPGYSMGHELIVSLLRDLAVDGSKLLDLGCSTGSLIAKCVTELRDRKISYVGIGTSEKMIQRATRISIEKGIDSKVILKVGTAESVSPETFDFVVAYYLFQFVSPSTRLLELKRVFDILTPGGYLFIFEKLYSDVGPTNSLITSAYWDFKRKNGFADAEIIDKHEALRGTMFPVNESLFMAQLESCGYSEITHIQRAYFFNGYLVRKPV